MLFEQPHFYILVKDVILLSFMAMVYFFKVEMLKKISLIKGNELKTLELYFLLSLVISVNFASISFVYKLKIFFLI